MVIDEARFRQTMGHFASGVTVVTTAYQGSAYGLTVSSFASLSLEPPLVLVCVDKRANSHDVIVQAKGFVVNMLADTQEHLSRQFAVSTGDRFAGVAWHASTLGFPMLEGALATIDCRLHDSLPGGDHTIFIGEVAETQIHEGKPLLYYRGGYHELV